MNRRIMPVLLALLSTASLVGGCASLNATLFSKNDGLSQVDDLLSQIERVLVESELCQERVRSASTALEGIVSPDFGGDAVTAYTEFVNAIDLSEEQAEQLRDAVNPMKKTAEEVFEQWASDLKAFASAEMRQKSQLRLEKTKERYKSILAAVEPAQWSYDAFNRGMRDHALFLGNDFNAASVSEIGDGVRVLKEQAEELEIRFNACLVAAQDYVRAASLPGHVEPPRQ